MRSTIVSKRKELITICLSTDRVSVLSGASGRSKTTSQLEAASKLPWYRGVTCKDIKDITPTVLILLGMFYWAFKKNNFYCNSTHDKYNWENRKGKLELFGEDCCSTTFEAALLPSVRERQLCFLAAAFKIPKSGKQSKVSFYSLFSKQSPNPNSQLFLYLAGPLSDFNLFVLFHAVRLLGSGEYHRNSNSKRQAEIAHITLLRAFSDSSSANDFISIDFWLLHFWFKYKCTFIYSHTFLWQKSARWNGQNLADTVHGVICFAWRTH